MAMNNTIDNGILNQLGIGSRPSDAPRDRLGQDDFMRLMVAQLSNQDPFEPMQNGEFLGQLAQFGTVSGIADLKRSVEMLAGSLSGNQTLQAATLVDREVLVPAREAWLPPGGVLKGAVEIPPGGAGVELEILDMSGRLLARVPVEQGQGGLARFVWDGSLPGGEQAGPGFYELRAAGNYYGQAVSLDVLVAGRVESVGLGGAQRSVALTVTGLGTVDLARVRGIS